MVPHGRALGCRDHSIIPTLQKGIIVITTTHVNSSVGENPPLTMVLRGLSCAG